MTKTPPSRALIHQTFLTVRNGWYARGALLALCAVFVAGALPPPDQVPGVGQGSSSDLGLHSAIVARLAAGGEYYVETGEELRGRGFPTGSVFNWRTPLLFSLLSLNPGAAKTLLVLLGILTLAATVRVLSRQAVVVIIAGAIAQAGALQMVFDGSLWVFHEVWAAYFVALSAFAYSHRLHNLGGILGLAALFIRELVAPYAFVCAVMALWQKRRMESVLWVLGALLYLAYYAYHFTQVEAHQQEGDVSHAASWIRFGGFPFILSTLRTNIWLYDAHRAVAAAGLVCVLAGLLDSRLAPHIRAAVGAYLAAFFVAGQPFNWYWGWLPSLLVPLAFAHGLSALPVLFAAAAGPRARLRVGLVRRPVADDSGDG